MNRRGFFGLLAGALAAPLLPKPDPLAGIVTTVGAIPTLTIHDGWPPRHFNCRCVSRG